MNHWNERDDRFDLDTLLHAAEAYGHLPRTSSTNEDQKVGELLKFNPFPATLCPTDQVAAFKGQLTAARKAA
jgi:hypothetical protein